MLKGLPGAASWGLLGRSRVPLGRFWEGLWGLLGSPEEVSAVLGRFWGCLGRPFGGFLEDSDAFSGISGFLVRTLLIF